jgi:hypothetical protein
MTGMQAASGAIRSVEIAGISPRAELLSVVRAGVVVIVAAAVYVATQRATAAGDARATKNLLPFQALIQTHSVVDQRTFRQLQVALLESQAMRAASGAWPDTATMAEQGIEPFADDPTNKGARYQWRLLRSGFVINYLGVPDRADAPAWLLTIQEPDPSAPPEAYSDDEEHARLPDGTLLHVSIWRHANGPRVARTLARVPQGLGWSQVFAVGRSATH